MQLNKLAPAVFAATLLWSAVTVAVSATAADDTGARMVSLHCNKCHDYSRICRRLGQNEAWWTDTVKRMNTHGADVEDAQVPATAAYLAGLTPGSAPICK